VAEALVALAAAARRTAAPAMERGGEPESAPALPRRLGAAVERLRARGGTATLDVAGGQRLEISYGAVRLGARAPVRDRAPEPTVIAGPGTYRCATGALDVTEGSGGRPERAGSAAFDAELVAWPLTLRARRAGDRARQPQAVGPDDRRQDRARRAGLAAGRGQRARRAAVRPWAAAGRDGAPDRAHPPGGALPFSSLTELVDAPRFAAKECLTLPGL